MSYFRAFLSVLLPLFLAMAFSTGLTPLAERYGKTGYPDCLYLLVILDRAMDYALRSDPSGAVLVEYAKRASVDPSLARLHADAYALLSRYLDIFAREQLQLDDPLRVVAVINDVSMALDKVTAYAERLHQCSHDRDASRTLLARVSSEIGTIRDTLVNVLNALIAATRIDVVAEISPEKAVYKPGDEITLLINGAGKESWLVEPVAFVYPAMLAVPLNYSWELLGERIALRLEVPTAASIDSAGLAHFAKGGFVDLALALRSGSVVRVLRVVKVEYSYPDVKVRAPVAVRRGDTFSAYVEAADNYEATLALNGVGLASLTLQPGLNSVLAVDTGRENVVVGTNRLEICVNATAKTLSKCYQFLFLVEPRYPRVSVHIPNPAITLAGTLNIAIYGEEPVELYCEISSGLDQDSFGLTGVTTRRILGGLLPVQLVDVRVEVVDSAGRYDKLVLSYSVVVVNALSLLATLAAAALVSASAHPYERHLVSLLAKSLRRATVPFSRLTPIDKVRSELLKPLELGLFSSVAQLYYKALRKLGVRQPLPSETLREHFEDGVKARPLSEKAKGLMWRFMLLVERDLYSRMKPELEEAKKVYGDVMDVAEK